ncbi:MAG: hypothetical protein ACHBN1_06035 [Heteroscytonema crispum UTEX LB 1556]
MALSHRRVRVQRLATEAAEVKASGTQLLSLADVGEAVRPWWFKAL